jgi:hypothetical protein
MIIIPHDKPWPTYDWVNPQGIPMTSLKSANLLIADAVATWWRKGPDKPTHIILPLRLERDFKASFNWAQYMAIQPAWPESDEPEFLGMKLILSQTKALELLGDLPR